MEKKKILIVHDNEDSRLLLSEMRSCLMWVSQVVMAY
jgi:CheY-like chemotaxis protein